jgi:hypothetical protein
MTILLLDGDVYAYRCASSCNPTQKKPYQEDEQAALARLEVMVQTTFKATSPKDFECYLGGKTNWRTAIYPEYKANRKDTARPIHLDACRNYLIERYEAQVVEGKEADDALGISQTAYGVESIISTNDKDMRTIPGRHHNPVTGETFFVSPFDALRYFYTQVVLGDKADNIPGYDGALRSVMPKFIERLCAPLQEMTEEWDMYRHVCSVYADYGVPIDSTDGHRISIMHKHAACLYIQRRENEYWSPPQQADPMEEL